MNTQASNSDEPMRLLTLLDTFAKGKAVDSSHLPEAEIIRVNARTEIPISWSQPAPNNHVLVEISDRDLVASQFNGRFNWNFWNDQSCIQILGNEKGNAPKDEPPTEDVGKLLKFPGFNGQYGVKEPIITGGNFTWGEATHGGTRIPHEPNVVHNFIKMAKVMQEIRVMFGDRPIKVNSWYRDPATNDRVGGASRSRHLMGDGIDFVIAGVHPQDVYQRLDGWWGNRGGLASTRSAAFTHIDGRGYRARWFYSF